MLEPASLPRQSWHRPVSEVTNEFLGYNQLYEGLGVAAILADIDDDNLSVSSCYVCERRSPIVEGLIPYINSGHEDEYTDNVFVTFGPGGQRSLFETNADPGANLISDLGLDPAMHELFRVLYGANKLLAAQRFFVIQGGVGCGKTTMLRHFIKKSPVLERFLPIWLDGLVAEQQIVGENAAQTSSRTTTMLIDLLTQSDPWFAQEANFGEIVRNIPTYSARIETDFRMAIQRHLKEAPVQLLSAFLTILNNRTHRLPLLVLDNVDRFVLNRQKEVLNAFWNIIGMSPSALGVLALREPTLRNHSTFTEQLHLNVMHLTSPEAMKVLKARLSAAKDDLKLRPKPPKIEIGPGNVVEFKSCQEFLSKWEKTLSSKDVVDFLRDTSNANIRELLKLAGIALSSKHLDIKRVLSKFYSSKDYNPREFGNPWDPRIPLDEVLRLVLLGGHSYYSSETSPIPNVFECITNPTAHENHTRVPCLLQLRILQYIGQAPKAGRDITEVFKQSFVLGFSNRETSWVIQTLVERNMVESYESGVVEKMRRIYLTYKGAYLSQKLFTHPIYIENIIDDCYIDYPESVHRKQAAFKDDVARVLKFITFLLAEENREYVFAKKRGEKDNGIVYGDMLPKIPICLLILEALCVRAKNVGLFEHHPNLQDWRDAGVLADRIKAAVSRGDLLGQRPEVEGAVSAIHAVLASRISHGRRSAAR